jgi:hypothetical protein
MATAAAFEPKTQLLSLSHLARPLGQCAGICARKSFAVQPHRFDETPGAHRRLRKIDQRLRFTRKRSD